LLNASRGVWTAHVSVSLMLSMSAFGTKADMLERLGTMRITNKKAVARF
jgi:hypothetical protein